MSEMNLWEGGIKIVTQEAHDKQNQENAGQVKFDTCQHRSDKEVERVKRTCCSSVKSSSWECNLRNIRKLIPETCASCTVYQKR